MWPYFLLLAAPASAAIMAVRGSALLIFVVALLYWFMIGWRFQIGVDWNNYLHMYHSAIGRPLGQLITEAEPAFSALLWVAYATGGGMILVNVAAALVFCWGFFAMAKQCAEPFLAISVATPLVVIVVAMSGIRQGMAMGVIYYLIATWEKRRTLGRAMFVLIASLFHFSALFMGAFVALGATFSLGARIAMAALALATTSGVYWLFPSRFDFYSEAYTGEGSVTAPGALAHVAILVAAALVYFTVRRQWRQVLGESELFKYLAVAALLMLPATYVSSVGASRFSFYLWPLAMYVWSGLPALLRTEASRYLYRAAVVGATVVILILWLKLANSSWAYMPYRNWWWEPEHAPLLRRRAS